MRLIWLNWLLLSITFVSSAVIQECVPEDRQDYFKRFQDEDDKILCEDLFKWIKQNAPSRGITRQEIKNAFHDECEIGNPFRGKFLIKDLNTANFLGIDMKALCATRSLYSEHVKQDPPPNGKCHGLRLGGIRLCKLGAYKGFMKDYWFPLLNNPMLAKFGGHYAPTGHEHNFKDIVDAINLQFIGFPVGTDKTITDLRTDLIIETFQWAVPMQFNPLMPVSARTPSFLYGKPEVRPETMEIPKNKEQCNIDEYTKFPLIDKKAKMKMGVIHEYDLRDPVCPSSNEQLKSAGFGAVGLVKFLADNLKGEAFTAFAISGEWLLTAGHCVNGWTGESPEISKNVPNNAGYKFYPGFNGIHSLLSKTECCCVHSHQRYILVSTSSHIVSIVTLINIQVTPSKLRTMSISLWFHMGITNQVGGNTILL